MNRLRSLYPILAICSITASVGAAGQSANPRSRILLDAGWRFHVASNIALKNAVSITRWRWRGAGDARPKSASGATEDSSGSGWTDAAIDQDVFQGRAGFAWFQAELPSIAGPGRIVQFGSVDDNATVFLNGKMLRQHEGWSDPFDVPLDSAWNKSGRNLLALLVENTAGPGGIYRSVLLGTDRPLTSGHPSRPGFDDRRWRIVHLPHDFVVEQKFSPLADVNHGSLPTPTAWYRKTFTLPAAARGKSVWIDFEGIYRNAAVYLNGDLLTIHPSGYTGFRCDISNKARFGAANVLAVFVDPRHHEGWWYEGGGIYRHVWLNIANPVHVAPWSTFVTSKLPEPAPGAKAAAATVTVRTTVVGKGGSGTLVATILGPNGAAVAQKRQPIRLAGPADLKESFVVRNPALWSLERPNLYRLRLEIRSARGPIDAEETRFGIRTIRFDKDKGFYLNGKHVKIQGVCNHQDFAGVGIAVPDSLEAYRVRRLKELGVNGWRMSHNPPTPSLLDACDRLGMLVMDENRHLGDTILDHTPAGTPFSDLHDLRDLILRDRNHPCVIMWSMCNEEGLQATPEGARIFKAMMNVVHKYDTTRPISCAMNGGWLEDGIARVEDLVGVNYSYDMYDPVRRRYPNKPMFGSETASTCTARGVYADDPDHLWVSSYNLTDGSWQPVAERQYMAGSFDWTGFDYKGEPTPYGWPEINSNFGIMDICGFPKDNYYYLQSWWTDRPVIHLMPHWNWPGKEGQPIRVVCFSNAARVELFWNDTSLGAQDMPRVGHLEWMVNYVPGRLYARGYARDGSVVSSTTVWTSGAPARLRLKTDRMTLSADGEDVQPVAVEVLDEQGRIVPTAMSRIAFKVTGAGFVAGVGNGNPSDHDPDKAGSRCAFNGLAMVVVGASDHPGPIRLRATSPGLAPTEITLTAVK
jgi:beta-galactosidase